MRIAIKYFFPFMFFAFAACGTQVSFKQGAGSDAFAHADRECRAQKEYRPCMETKGWSVHRTNELSPLLVPVLSDNRTGKQTSQDPAAPAVKRDEKGNPLPPDPMEKLNVAAWGRMGGGPADLQVATDTCVDQLGSAHKPERDSPMMTRAMVLCLHDRGWYGLQGY
jgi:hypothetical protein